MSSVAHLFRLSKDDQGTADLISFENHGDVEFTDADQQALVALEHHAQLLDDVSNVLSGIALSMESQLQTGGLKPIDMLYANHAVQLQLSRIDDSMMTVSHEDVGSALTRVEATSKTGESVAAKLRELWDRVMAALKHVWDVIVKFFQDQFTRAGRLEQAAQHVLDEARKIRVVGDSTGKTLSLGPLGRKISVDGSLNYPLVPALQALTDQAHQLAERSVATGQQQAKALAALLHQQGNLLMTKDSLQFIHVGKFTPPSQFKHLGTEQQYGIDCDVYHSPPFPGERVIQVLVPKKDLGDAARYSKDIGEWVRDQSAAIGRVQFKVVAYEGGAAFNEDISQIPMPSPNDIEDIAHAVAASARLFKDFSHKAQDVHREATNELKRVTQDVTTAHSGKMFSTHGVIYLVLASTYGRVARQLLTPSMVVCGLTMTVAGSFLNVAEKALSSYDTATGNA